MSTTHRQAGAAGPVENKVKASTAAAAAIGFVLDALSNGIQNTDHGVLLNGLPDWLEPILVAVITGLPTFAAGWAAKHTHRPDLRGSTTTINPPVL